MERWAGFLITRCPHRDFCVGLLVDDDGHTTCSRPLELTPPSETFDHPAWVVPERPRSRCSDAGLYSLPPAATSASTRTSRSMRAASIRPPVLRLLRSQGACRD